MVAFGNADGLLEMGGFFPLNCEVRKARWETCSLGLGIVFQRAVGMSVAYVEDELESRR